MQGTAQNEEEKEEERRGFAGMDSTSFSTSRILESRDIRHERSKVLNMYDIPFPAWWLLGVWEARWKA